MLTFQRVIEWISICFVAVFFMSANSVQAGKEYEVFDGQTYNGKYYPRIDFMEVSDAGEPSHMEFHVYSKDKPIDISFMYEKSGDAPVMDVNYYITERKENVCGRRVLAPTHFKNGFLVYKDTSDSEYDNILVSMVPMPDKKGRTLLKTPTNMACGGETEITRGVASSSEK